MVRLVVSIPSLATLAFILLASRCCNCFVQKTHFAVPPSVISPSQVEFLTASTVADRQRPQQRSNGRYTISSSRRDQASATSTALNVWWFGGTAQGENNIDDDSCELVAVRIERTSPNSRRIAGEITVESALDNVWNILTDYDRLAVHVPNLMESRIVKENGGGIPGDGRYRCRLFQVGSQKIIGFDFSASVTMDMTEMIVTPPNAHATSASGTPIRRPQERKIKFKCVDSQFFTEFDGAWTVKEQRNPATGETETLCSYVVDVRPKGPVPVGALEWRIREDVPTNLRAVKAATLRQNVAPNAFAQRIVPMSTSNKAAASGRSKTDGVPVPLQLATNDVRSRSVASRLSSFMVDWDRDETMAKYL
jgi:Polyketide cyclase / dehydrase and lipid transport